MPKSKIIYFLVYTSIFWLLINICWGISFLFLESRIQWNIVFEAFLGINQAYHIFYGRLPYYLWSLPLMLLLLSWWLENPTIFKALFLVGLAPYVGFLAFSNSTDFIISPFWTAGFILLGIIIKLVNRFIGTPPTKLARD